MGFLTELPGKDSLKKALSDEAEVKSSGLSAFTSNAIDSFQYTLVQAPLNGASQLIDHVAGTDLLPKVQIFQAPQHAETGSAAWLGQVVGGTAGAAAPFIAMHKLVGPGAAGRLEMTAEYGLSRTALPSISKSVLTGALYSGILTPVGEGEGDFWTARLRHAAVGGATFGTLTASTIGMKSSGLAFLRNDIVSGALSGVPAGIVSADANALLSSGKLSSGSERLQAVANYAIGGGLLGAANIADEYVRPTSGIRGVRTLEEMKQLADTTMTSGERTPSPLELAGKASRAAFAGKTTPWYEQVSNTLEKELSGTPLPAEHRDRVATGQKELMRSLDALSNVGPTATIYGSARLGPETFQYQRARYMAGLLAKEGYAVMDGGGGGIMEAANKGAYEAGGVSIGVNVELPREQKPNPYQTISLQHKYFSTRKDVLRQANAFVVEEGGIGTMDEAMELLTLIQTGKMGSTPVFLMGSKFWKPLDRFFQQSLLATGTISPSDRNLYQIVDSPKQVIQSLRASEASVPASLPLAQPYPAQGERFTQKWAFAFPKAGRSN